VVKHIYFVAIVAILALLSQFSVAADFRDKADIAMERLVKEDFSYVVSEFSDELAVDHPVDELEEVWFKSLNRYGPYQWHRFGKASEQDTAISYFYILQLERARLATVFAYGMDGTITAFILQPPEGEPVLTEPSWIVPFFPEVREPFYRIPDYVDTSRFNEMEFVMQGGAPIPATMTTAITDEPNPVVLLFHGFGPTDRDESLGEIKPLRDIAWGLASMGIASLRFDSRAYMQPPDSIAGLDLDGYILNDIGALLAYIRMQTAIFDTTRIFIAGHGMGGLVVPLAADRDGGLAGGILLSAPAQPPDEMLLDIAREDFPEDDPETSADAAKLAQVVEILTDLKNRKIPPDEMILFAPAQVWYDLMDNYHVEIAKKLEIPLLIIQSSSANKGEAGDFKIWQRELGDNPRVTIKKYEYLNHFFQRDGKRANKAGEGSDNGSVSFQLIKDLAAWIKSR